MGFDLMCMIVPADGELAERIAAAASQVPHVTARRILEPFAAVVAATPDDLVERFYRKELPEIADDYDAKALSYGLAEALPELSRRFPGQKFGHVSVDCSGGRCLYSGHVVLDGAEIWRLDELMEDGHQQVFRALGLPRGDFFFEPFTRGYFDPAASGGAAGAEPRRALTAAIGGVVRFELGVDVLEKHLALLPSVPWRITIATEQSIILTFGEDDLVLSLNTQRDGTLELGGHVRGDRDQAFAQFRELIERGFDEAGASYDLTAIDLAGRPLATWRA